MLSVEEKNARRREKYRQNPELYKARAQAWRVENPGYVKSQNDQYYETNKEKCLELMQQYRNTSEGKAAALKSRNKHKEKNCERARLWRVNHPGATTKQQQAWKAKNPDKYRLSNANKYAFRQLLGAANWKLDVCQLQHFISQQDGKCYYCDAILGSSFHLEHKAPLSKGGLHILDNLCLSCSRCNLSKHNKTEVEFRNYLNKER